MIATPAHRTREHLIYLLLSHSGDPLYVGMTTNLPARLRSHRSTKSWWQDVACHQIVDRAHGYVPARVQERQAIRRLSPRHNVAETADYKGSEVHAKGLKAEPALIREWARSRGIHVCPIGRLPVAAVHAYAAANSTA